VRLFAPKNDAAHHEALTPLYDSVPDADFGYVARREASRDARKGISGGELCYDVVYRTDRYGRRITSSEPSIEGETTQQETRPHLLLFGGSVTFGEGLPDADTLAQHLSERLPDRAVYTYAQSGYGPAHALAKMQSRELQDELPGVRGDALYLLIPAHVDRVIGSTRSPWIYDSPRYVVDDAAGVERRGSFRSSQPWRTATHLSIEWLRSRSRLFNLINLHLPVRITDKDLDLLTQILGELRASYRAQFQGELSVVLHPLWKKDGIHAGDAILAGIRLGLDAQALPHIDYASYEAQPTDWIGDCDPHPSGRLNANLARWIVRDLAAAR